MAEGEAGVVRFWIREASGTLHEGVHVLGAGGTVRINGEERMRIAIERAGQQLPGPFFEPKRGYVLGFHENARLRHDEREINLAGATLVQAVPG